jgi:hypothetical protein
MEAPAGLMSSQSDEVGNEAVASNTREAETCERGQTRTTSV